MHTVQPHKYETLTKTEYFFHEYTKLHNILQKDHFKLKELLWYSTPPTAIFVCL